MDVKVIANVGYWKGDNGIGLMYVGKSVGATPSYLMMIQFLEEGENVWKYLRKSQVQNILVDPLSNIASNFNLALLTDVEQPDFVGSSDTEVFKTIPTVIGADGLPRLYQLQTAYSLKGEGVTTAELEAVKYSIAKEAETGTGTGTSSTTGGMFDGIIPSDFSGLFNNPFQWMQDNIKFILIVGGAIYFFRRKKKKPLWIF